MTVLYVASDQEGAGKTSLCITLARKVAQGGRSVALFKPLAGAGLSPGLDPDPAIFYTLVGQRAEGWPLDLPGGGLTTGVLERIEAVFNKASDGVDVVIVEGSCALRLEESAQVVNALGARVLGVVRYQQDLSASELKVWQELLGERLAGFVVNGLTCYQGTHARSKLVPSMESAGLTVFGIIPEDRRLLAVSVGQLAEHLEGRFIVCHGKADALVEHLMVGGMGMDPGELYFGQRENKAVIVRGDRPDIQMAALATPTACLVLTGGIEPIEYVKYEAEQEEVPLMVVNMDTLSTMGALSTLVGRARFDHPLKLGRFAELLERHVDLPLLLKASGLGV